MANNGNDADRDQPLLPAGEWLRAAVAGGLLLAPVLLLAALNS